MHLENQIKSILLIKNIYKAKKLLCNHPFINPLFLSKQFPQQLHSLSNPKYLGDAIVICDLFSAGLCNINMLIELISRALQHNFHRGKRRHFLVLLGRLPYFMGVFESQHINIPMRN
jgi:uncharacterized protein VirK/YbjX